MKKIVFILLAFILTISVISFKKAGGDCNMVITYAELAYKNFKDAGKATSVELAAPMIKKGIEQANEAAAYAVSEKCNCANAKNYALNAVTFGKKAQKAQDLKELQKQSKKAMNMSLDVVSSIPGCK